MLDFLAAYFGSDNALTFILWPIFIGILLGILYSILQNQLVGKLVKRLFAEEITSAEQAKTLAELGYTKTFFLRWALRKNASLRRIVLLKPANEEPDPDLLLLCVPEEEEAKETLDASEQATEVDAADAVEDEAEDETTPEEEPRVVDPALAAVAKNSAKKADLAHDKWFLNPRELKRAALYNRDGASPLMTVLGIIALFGLAIAAFYLIPFITDLASSIF